MVKGVKINDEIENLEFKKQIIKLIKSECAGAKISANKSGIKIVHCTVKFITSSEITWDFLIQTSPSALLEVLDKICKKHHYELSYKIKQEQYKEALELSTQTTKNSENHVVVCDTACPKDKSFICMHPEFLLKHQQEQPE